MDPDPQRRFPQKKKRPKGHASLLHAADVFRIITERVSVNGPTRVSLRGRALSGPDAVKAVCDAVLELGRQGSWIGNNQTRISPTTTLNLASGNVCPAGLEHLVNLLLDKRCQLKELNLVDNPKLGVHLRDVQDTPPAHTVTHADDDTVVDGNGCEILARAIRSNSCTLTQLNLGGCGITCKGAGALANALAGFEDGVGDAVGDAGDNDRLNTHRRTTVGSPNLEHLNLRSNDVGYAGVCELATACAKHGVVREVSLGNNTMVTDTARRELHDVLSRNRKRALLTELGAACEESGEKSISLRRRRLSDADAATIAGAIRPGGCADCLVSLDVSENDFTSVGIDTLAHAVRGVTGNMSLASVSVVGNPGAHFDGEKCGSDSQTASDRNASNFKNDSCDTKKSKVNFTTAAQKLLGVVAANFLLHSGTGEALKSIADRGLGCAGAREVAGVVSATTAFARDDRSWAFVVTAIGTQHNEIGYEGCTAIANAFAMLPNLVEWACYANPIGANGASSIARSISAPGAFLKLKSLDIGGSNIGDSGCCAISFAIVGHAALQELHLDHNDIGNTGGSALVRSMERTADSNRGAPTRYAGLRRVWLHGNPRVPDVLIGRVHELANRTATKDNLEAQTRGGTCGGTSGFELQSELESVVTKNSVDAFVYERAERHARFCFDGNKQSRHLHRSVDTSSFFADRVAANAICTYVYRLPDHVETTRGNAVVAAIVAHSTGRGGDCDAPGAGDYLRTIGHRPIHAQHGTDTFRVTIQALGVGTKFMPNAVAIAASAGTANRYEHVVHDSHAEVLARRALLRYLNREMRELVLEHTTHVSNSNNQGWPTAAPDLVISSMGKQIETETETFRETQTETFRVLTLAGDGSGFRLKPGTSLHLYVSTAPCGAASATKETFTFAEGAVDLRSNDSSNDTVRNLAPKGVTFGVSSVSRDTAPMRHDGVTHGHKTNTQNRQPRDVSEYDLDDVSYAESFADVDERHERGVYACGGSRNAKAMTKGAMPVQSRETAPAPGCVPLKNLASAFGTPGLTLSCSDKISRWQVLGAQGAALSVLIQNPIAFSSLVVGRKFDGDSLRRGTCCRTAGFPHAVFKLSKPKHLSVLKTNVKVSAIGGDTNDDAASTDSGAGFTMNSNSRPFQKTTTGKNRAGFIADQSRAGAGDSDESWTWCHGETVCTRHDGRTGMSVGGGGPTPVVARAWQFADFQKTLGALRGKREVLDLRVDDKLFSVKNAQDAKALAVTYAAGKHAMLKARVPPTSAIVGWRGSS